MELHNMFTHELVQWLTIWLLMFDVWLLRRKVDRLEVKR